MATSEIGIMCNEQYQHLRELLGKSRSITSIDFFDVEEEKIIVIDGEKVEVEFSDYRSGGDFFRVDRIEPKVGENIKIELKHTSAEENYQFTDMPTEG